LRSDGTLWAWGVNFDGQLGGTTGGASGSPVQIGSATDWSSVACGDNHTVALRSDGTLWAWGANSYGQLGDGTTTQRNSPVQIGRDTDWAFVGCGGYHTVALRGDGALWAWGYNSLGQLGDGTTTQRNSPVQIGSATDWAFFACGRFHTAASRSDSTLWAWGSNFSGRLGDGTTTQRNSPVQIGTATDWSSVTCGDSHTAALRSDGTLWAWGDNSNGRLGDGTTTQRRSPVQIGSDTDWSFVDCGGYHTVALRSDGTLCAWGDNSYGQLGDGDGYDTTYPKRSLPARAQQILTFPAPVLSSGSSVDLVATSTSGLPVNYFVTGAGTLDGNTLTATGAGTIWVTASQPGDDNWDAAEPIRHEVAGIPAPVLVVEDTIGNTYASGDTLDLGTQTIGGGMPTTLQIRNDGSVNLTVQVMPLSGDFSHNGVGMDTIAPSSMESYEILFEPTVSGPQNVVLEIQSSDVNQSGFTLNLTGIGNSPVSFSGASFNTAYETPAQLAVSEILANASDADGDTISVLAVESTTSAGGTASLGESFITYTPPSGFSAGDVLTVTLDDGRGGGGSFDIDIIVNPPTGSPYTVTFDLDGKATRTGGGPLSQMIEINQSALAPSVSANAGWIFQGWDVPFDHITGNLTVTARFTPDYRNLQPGQSVTTSANRVPSSPSSSNVTVEMGDLTIQEGANFGLGVNETLVLTDGPLVIEQGGVFQGNGSIIGDVINAGLIIIRIMEETILPNLTSNDGIFSIVRENRETPLVIDSPIGNSGVFATDGSLEVTGTFTQTSTGMLRLFIEGENPGIDYSQLTVGDTVDLDGELQVVLNQAKFDPFSLDVGDTFDLVRIDPAVSGKVITLRPSFSYRVMATQKIEDQMIAAGLTTSPYVGLENDPDKLVELDGNLFSFALAEGDTVMRATFQGDPSLQINPVFLLGSDTDPGSDVWEIANGFDPNIDGDVTSKDSDGDGDPDILEIFQGTLGTPGAPAFSYGDSLLDRSTGSLKVGFRRASGALAVKAEGKWSPDTVNWYSSGETAPGGTRVSFNEVINDMGSYEIVNVLVVVEDGAPPTLFYRLELVPNE